MIPDLDLAFAQALSRFQADEPWQARYRMYRHYYAGDQPMPLGNAEQAEAFGAYYRPGPDNMCAAVVDALADRLDVTGFQATGDGLTDTERERIEQEAWRIWTANKLTSRANEAHQGAIRDGDSYVIVWYSPDDPGVARIYPQRADLMRVWYDPDTPGRVLWAAKAWQDEAKYVRLTLYGPDRLLKFITRQPQQSGLTTTLKMDAFVPYPDEPDVANPYGVVPVMHFGNNATLGSYGWSELVQAIPSQDRLNKTLADMELAREFVAFPQRLLIGLEVPIDAATGLPTPEAKRELRAAAYRRIMTIANPDAKGFEFSAGDLRQFLEAAEDARLAIARNTGTPLHYILPTSNPPSGEALKALEARFVKKVKDRQTAFGETWAQAMTLALRIEQVIGRDDDPALATQWTEAAPVSQREQMEAAELAKRAEVPWRERMQIAGYSDAEIEAMEPPAAAGAGSAAAVEAG